MVSTHLMSVSVVVVSDSRELSRVVGVSHVEDGQRVFVVAEADVLTVVSLIKASSVLLVHYEAKVVKILKFYN